MTEMIESTDLLMMFNSIKTKSNEDNGIMTFYTKRRRLPSLNNDQFCGKRINMTMITREVDHQDAGFLGELNLPLSTKNEYKYFTQINLSELSGFNYIDLSFSFLYDLKEITLSMVNPSEPNKFITVKTWTPDQVKDSRVYIDDQDPNVYFKMSGVFKVHLCLTYRLQNDPFFKDNELVTLGVMYLDIPYIQLLNNRLYKVQGSDPWSIKDAVNARFRIVQE